LGPAVQPELDVTQSEQRFKGVAEQIPLGWLTPDGREIDPGTYSMQSAFSYFPDQDQRL